MPISLLNTDIRGSGSVSISASGSTYGIVQDSGGRVRLPLNTAFFAYGVRDNTFQPNNVWRFSVAPLNTGSPYVVTNGRFTAPVAGTYVFYWTNIGSNTSSVQRYFIRRNGTNIRDNHFRADSTSTGSNYSHNGEKFFMTNCAANDFIEIFFQSDQGVNSYPNTNSNNGYPTFQGWLLA